MNRALVFAMFPLWLLQFAAPARGALIEVTYSGSFAYIFREPDAPYRSIVPGTPWTARLLFDDTAENQHPPDNLDRSIAVYQGISVELAIGDSLFHLAPVTIGVGDNAYLGDLVVADWVDVFAGPSAELYLSLFDQTLAAIHTTALPTSIQIADWPSHEIVFSGDGYATGSIDRITSRVIPEPTSIALAALVLVALAMVQKRSGMRENRDAAPVCETSTRVTKTRNTP